MTDYISNIDIGIEIGTNLSWTPAIQNTNLDNNAWHDIAYDGTKLVALGARGLISTSTNGENWTTAVQNTDLGENEWEALAYNGTKFVALGSYSHISTSTDGTTWTTAVQDTNLGNNSWRALAYDGTKFVALDAGGYISTSIDGITWAIAVQDTNLGNNVWKALAYDGTKFLALSQIGYISTSTDGTTWTTAVQDTNLGNNSWYDLAYDGTKFVALSNFGYISTSTDGETWTTAVYNTNLGSNLWYSLTYDGIKFVALSFLNGYISVGTNIPITKIPIGGTNFDGQWVQSFMTIVETAGTKAGVEFDLSSYLPNDNYIYEVKFKMYGYDNDSTYSYYLNTDVFDNGQTTTSVETVYSHIYGGTYSRQNVSVFDLPVGTGRYVRLYGSGADDINIYALGYHRIGTNE